MKKPILTFVSEQWKPCPKLATADLSGKTVMVVGANTGLGLEASKHFARMNPARLILACRNRDKGEAAVNKIKEETKSENVELMIVDLGNFDSTASLAETYQKDGARLDILVMNAGISTFNYTASPHGYESTIQVNHLSTSLFSLLMIPTLLRTAKEHGTTSRLVIVSSEVHYWSTIQKDALESPNMLMKLSDSPMGGRYPLSKLLNVLFTRALNDHLPPDAPLIVDTVNPGYCSSELNRNMNFIVRLLASLMEKALAHTSEEGSRQLVYAAVGGQEDETKLRGGYVHMNKVDEVSDFVLSEEGKTAQSKLWTETLEVLGKASPKVHDVVREYLTT